MFKIKINQNSTFQTEAKDDLIFVDGIANELNMVHIGANRYHFIYQNKSYTAELLEVELGKKLMKIKVNHQVYELEITDKYDELLRNLGLDHFENLKIKEIKAPMPGLVLKILVKEGDMVKKGDNLLVLEAMKMENMIKSPSEVIIKKIRFNSGDIVEKNQVLIDFN